MTAIMRTQLLAKFTCLGDKCEDTCCQGWSMQADEPTLERYRKEAPQLMEAIEADHDGSPIMRKDKASGFCVKLEGGLCGIHKQYGSTFLGDACYFYPRATRALGGQTVMSAAMSCPEIVRLALADENAGMLEVAEAERLPHTVKNYLPQEISESDALAIHRAFLDTTKDKQASAETIFLRIANASRSLERTDKKDWPAKVEFYLKNADAHIPPPETNIADPFNLLHALCGLIVASRKKPSVRLKQTVDDMERALAVTLDWENVLIHTTDSSLPAYQQLLPRWQQKEAQFAAPLRRWLMMQLSLALYPFAGLGNTLPDRITLIGVRLATVKLAFMCSDGSPDTVVRVIQSLSRFLDHLGDPAFSLSIYNETGWVKEGRMRGLLEV